jgi:hypothetical protein
MQMHYAAGAKMLKVLEPEAYAARAKERMLARKNIELAGALQTRTRSSGSKMSKAEARKEARKIKQSSLMRRL